jgi:hypothetical protein
MNPHLITSIEGVIEACEFLRHRYPHAYGEPEKNLHINLKRLIDEYRKGEPKLNPKGIESSNRGSECVLPESHSSGSEIQGN